MKRSGKIFTTAMLAVTLMVPSLGVSADEGNAGSNGNGNETFRVLVDSDNQKNLNNVKSQYGVHWDFEDEGFTTNMNEKQFNALQKNKNITVEKVPEFEIATSSDQPEAKYSAMAASQSTPWGIEAIYNDSNITQTSGGAGINIAVLDTGVYAGHPDLKNSVEQCKDFTVGTTYTNDSCTDNHGHGTHVAGSALADGGTGNGVYGVAPDADLWAYKVLGDDGSGYSDDIAAAIRHAGDQASALGTKVVVNMSLGSSTESSLITSAVDYAYGKGVLIIAAAGNSGPAMGTIGYPGAVKNAVAVAALENKIQSGTYRVADFSSRGYLWTDGDYVIDKGDVEISAPGAAIYSTYKDGGYATMNGTSMASPHAAGLAAKIWSQYPSSTNVDIRGELQYRAYENDILSGYGAGYGDDYASGFGFATVQ